jgi:hypothetical protein
VATTLIQGTKEYLIIDVQDKKGALSSLDAANPRFTVYDNVNTQWYTNEPADNIGMSVYCLVDTSAAHTLGLWPVGEYRIDVLFDTPAEEPVLAAGRFTVAAP